MFFSLATNRKRHGKPMMLNCRCYYYCCCPLSFLSKHVRETLAFLLENSNRRLYLSFSSLLMGKLSSLANSSERTIGLSPQFSQLTHHLGRSGKLLDAGSSSLLPPGPLPPRQNTHSTLAAQLH